MKISLFLLLLLINCVPIAKGCVKPATIVILLDVSENATQSSFKKLRDMASEGLEVFHVGPSAKDTHVALVTNDLTNIVFDLEAHNTTAEVQKAIRNAQYTSREKDLEFAMHVAAFSVFRRYIKRSNNARVLVIFTDYHDSGVINFRFASDQLKTLGVSVIAIGLGYNVNTDDLYGMVHGTLKNAPTVLEIKYFLDIYATVCQQITKGIPTLPINGAGNCETRPIDVVFVVHTSRNADVSKVKRAISRLVGTMVVAPDIHKTHVAMVTVDDNPKVVFTLDVYDTTAEVQAAIVGANYTGGNASIGLAMNTTTHLVIRQIANHFVNSRFMVVVTDSYDKKNVESAQNEAAKFGVAVIALGIGHGVSMVQLVEMAGSGDRVLYAPNYDSLNPIFDTMCEMMSKKKSHVNPPPAGRYSHNESQDMIFVVDKSISVGQDEFEKIKHAVQTMVHKMIDTLGKSHFYFDMFTFSHNLTTEVDFKTSGEKAILSEPYTPHEGSGIASGMRIAIEKFQIDTLSTCLKYMVVVVGSCSTTDVESAQKEAVSKNITVISVGVGPNADLTKLVTIAGSMERVFYTAKFDTLPRILNDVVLKMDKDFYPNKCKHNRNFEPNSTIAPNQAPRSTH